MSPVQCSQQGQCVSGKEHVVGRKLFESCPVAPHFVWLPHGTESAVHLVAQPHPKGHCGCYRIKDKRDQSRQTTCERMPGKSDVFFKKESRDPPIRPQKHSLPCCNH